MLTGLDIAIILVCTGAIILETKRGFGRALNDFIALLITIRTAPMLADRMEDAIRFSARPAGNDAAAYAVSFILIGGILLFAGKLIYDTTLVSADTFDSFLGGIFGIIVAIMLCHSMTRTVALDAGMKRHPDVIPEVITTSMFGSEFLNFEIYHRVVYTLHNLGRED